MAERQEPIVERAETSAPAVTPVATVVAGEFVHEEFPPAAPATSPAPAPREPVRAAPPPVQLEWPSDLVQVESDPQKVQALRDAVPDEPQPRKKRERPTPPPVHEEPLVQIETHKSDMPAEGSGAPGSERTASTS